MKSNTLGCEYIKNVLKSKAIVKWEYRIQNLRIISKKEIMSKINGWVHGVYKYDYYFDMRYVMSNKGIRNNDCSTDKKLPFLVWVFLTKSLVDTFQQRVKMG